MEIKKRWLAVFVENQVGVLAKISGLCSSKLYNIESITVGTTADPTISRMTFGFLSNDATFEQIKKQMNRCVEVIKVIDLTDIPTHMKELMFIKLKINSPIEKEEIMEKLAMIEEICSLPLTRKKKWDKLRPGYI